MAKLESCIQQKSTIKTPNGSYFTANPLAKKGKVAFVYPGSAAAYEQMGKDIFQLFPQLHTHFEAKVPDMAEFVGA